MPIFLDMIGDTDETVSRPVVYDVVRQMLKETGLPLEHNIIFPTSGAVVPQAGSTINSKSRHLKMMFDDQIFLEVDEQYNKEMLSATAVYQPENLPVFLDRALEVDVRPTYSTSSVSINVKYRASSRVEAIKWRDEMRMRVSMNRDVRLHEASYYFWINPTILTILKEIHRLRENVAGYGDTWDEYFMKHASTKCSVASDLAGKNTSWMYSQTQMRIQALFDWDAVPEQGSKEEGETWTIQFAYKFDYQRPVGLVMSYPLMFHNQLIGQKYRPGPGDRPYEIEHQLREYTWSARAFALFETSIPLNKLALREGLQLPDFDEFVPLNGSVLPDTSRVITMLINIDPNQPKLLLNLKELGDYNFDPDVLEFMKGEAPWMTQLYGSVFQVSLYEGRRRKDNAITIDADLNVWAINELDLRQYYHIRVSLVDDLRLVRGKGTKRLQPHCSAALKILDAIDPTLKYQGKLPVCMPGNWLGNKDLDNTIDDINSGVIGKGNQQQYGPMKTVQTQSIQSYRIKGN